MASGHRCVTVCYGRVVVCAGHRLRPRNTWSSVLSSGAPRRVGNDSRTTLDGRHALKSQMASPPHSRWFTGDGPPGRGYCNGRL
ncbi:hypothetical protein EYF80_049821 [Liparis tanakae]|uniref:Uncharacterized protein n=1 Tax=Liparis tanakae TaxID=230148 RepID=A0A4Z2FGX7_9TELE|nr:hypothetical protein EYF80_049821 [Liparis tanakae]